MQFIKIGNVEWGIVVENPGSITFSAGFDDEVSFLLTAAFDRARPMCVRSVGRRAGAETVIERFRCPSQAMQYNTSGAPCQRTVKKQFS